MTRARAERQEGLQTAVVWDSRGELVECHCYRVTQRVLAVRRRQEEEEEEI